MRGRTAQLFTSTNNKGEEKRIPSGQRQFKKSSKQLSKDYTGGVQHLPNTTQPEHVYNVILVSPVEFSCVVRGRY